MSMDYKAYAAQMRAAAPVSDEVMKVSRALWLQIADIVENLQKKTEGCEECETAQTEWELIHIAPSMEYVRDLVAAAAAGGVLRVPYKLGTMVRIKGREGIWKIKSYCFEEKHRRVIIEQDDRLRCYSVEELQERAEVLK